MFVSQSSYDQEVRKRVLAEMEFERAVKRYNRLIDRINRLGGEDFLNNATLDHPNQFDRSDLNTLIHLCHPDKHNGKPSANNMTMKLIVLRKEL